MDLDLETEIARLERYYFTRFGAPTAGTVISRILVDQGWVEKMGLKKRDSSKSVLVWSVGVGWLNGPIAFGYGHTVTEAIGKTSKMLRKLQMPAKYTVTPKTKTFHNWE